MHYGTPSSLPSDYALLSRYANANRIPNRHDFLDEFHGLTEQTVVKHHVVPNCRTIRRRSSFPSPYLRPLQPTTPEQFSSKISVPDEYTPLLVPRIQEADGARTDPAHLPTATSIYSDELRILIKYMLPVLW
jgi:multidrug resistance protein, MATE family